MRYLAATCFILWAFAGAAQPTNGAAQLTTGAAQPAIAGWDAEGRRQLLECIDSAAWLGLDSAAYRPDFLRSLEERTDEQANREFTLATLKFAHDLWHGAGIERMISYDGVSPAYAARDEDTLPAILARAEPSRLRETLKNLEPKTAEYATLKTALRQALQQAGTEGPRDALTDTIARLSTALNTLRWVHHFQFERVIVANIPSATLRYYAADTLNLHMRIVAGQPSKRTPRFAGWVDGLILYPYWNIPRHIATHELLPVLKKAPAVASLMELQVLDSRGRELDPNAINWARYTAADFPYTLRQAPGCQNALGVLKFNISSPFDVYMHDTNVKRAFGTSWRFLSHGCIRLEKPFLLGNILMDHRLDTVMLNSCLRNQQPVPVDLRPRVAVFVLYNTVQAYPDGTVRWFKDIYHLLP
jgi:murein L,D-transpeptidase YcbB/YkuD